MRTILYSIILTLTIFSISKDTNAQIPQKAGFGKYALMGGTIHTVTNGTIESGVVLINGNLIEFVGSNVKIDDGYKVIDVTGKHIYPGLIDAGTSLGLVEISAVPVTVDNAEIGDFNPHMRAFTAINPNSVAIPVTRVEGVTTVLSNPSSGVISGKSTLINLYGYSPDSMAVLPNAALFLNWPASGRRGFWDQRDQAEIDREYAQSIKQLDDYLSKARFYSRMMDDFEAGKAGTSRPDRNASLEAMREVVNGNIPVIINVDRESDILKSLEWAASQQGLKFVLNSVAEGWRVANEISESGIPVIVGPTLRTPTRSHDNYQRPYQNPAMLHDAGVKIAIRTGQTENVRNLPFNAGYAATYGLGKEEALKAITINPAEILGVDHLLGSIEVGKMANIVVADGDILETMTTIDQVFINGFKVPMTSRQIKLFEEFLERDVR